MKKYIFTVLALLISTAVYAEDDFLYERIIIPNAIVPKQVTVEQKDYIDDVTTEKKQSNSEVQTVYDDYRVKSNLYYPIMNMLGKYKNEIRVIYSDIDGVIVPQNHSNVLYEENLYGVFNKLKNNNIPVIFTTSRTFRETKKLSNEFEVAPKYYITQNGAEVVNPDGELIYETPIDLKTKLHINHEVKWFNLMYGKRIKIVFYQRGQAYTYRNSNIPDLLDVPVEIDQYSQLPKQAPSMIRVYNENPQTLSKFKRYMQHNFPTLNIYDVNANMFDITTENATKANAVYAVSEMLNIPIKNTAVFGYTDEDVSLLKYVRENDGLTVSTEKSVQAVKDESLYVTKPVENNGFSFAVDAILGNNMIIKSQKE